jgi:uncharacterized protein YndB with AHSA1/START domain
VRFALGMDVTAHRQIAAAPEQVAAVMFDPRRDPEWIGGADAVEPPKGDPTKVGARTTRHGGFMGRKFSWQTEVVEHRPARLLGMKFVAGPMKGGEVTYQIEPESGGANVSIRNTGPGPQFLGWFVKRSVGKDLDRLAALVSASAPTDRAFSARG